MNKEVQDNLNMIIDEIHPLFKSITDEEMIECYEEYGRFQRTFLHQNGKRFLMKWKVYFGTPETVRTVFEPAITL